MGKLREVRIDICKRRYRMQTTLDEATFLRVVSIVEEVGEAIGESADQNNQLMLTCLQLAYSLEKISNTLGTLEKKLGKLPPWDPAESQSDIG